MAEYIERDAAIKAAEHAWNEWNLAMAAADGAREINLVYKRQELCKAVASVFDSAPAADVAPVVHGRWREAGPLLECPFCGEIYSRVGGNSGKSWNYCPNCGVRMDKGADEDAACIPDGDPG